MVGRYKEIPYTVKNGYFGKILTLHRKTAKLPICFSDSFFVVDTNIYCLVTNRDFHCVYGCCNSSADWKFPKSRYFSESSLFVPSYFSSVSHEKEGEGRGYIRGIKFFFMFLVSIPFYIISCVYARQG